MDKYCTECGEQLAPGQHYCTGCGRAVVSGGPASARAGDTGTASEETTWIPTGAPFVQQPPATPSQPDAPSTVRAAAGEESGTVVNDRPRADSGVRPPRPHTWALALLISLVILVAAGGVGATIFALTRPAARGVGPSNTTGVTTPAVENSPEDGPKPSAPLPKSSSLLPPVGTSTEETGGTSNSPPAAGDPEEAALAMLNQLTDADHNAVEGLLDQWVPQVSSKQVGLIDPKDRRWPTTPYNNQRILENFREWQSRYPDVLLLRSSDYLSYRPGYWVTVIPFPSSDPDSVLSWCKQQDLSSNDCFASKISHTVPVGSGTSKRQQ